MKDLKISEELLSEVLNINDIIHVQKEGSNSIFISRINNPAYIINIYEFAFKCKEWASEKEYQIISGLSDEPAYRPQDEKAYAKVLWYEGDDIHREYKDMYFMANTEVEAVIKASEYVLKELNENR